MKCSVVGGGPAGLHLALLLRADGHEVELWERRRGVEGFGITLPADLHALLGRWDLEGRYADAPAWNRGEILVGPESFSFEVQALRGLARADLVAALAARAAERGVRLREEAVQDPAQLDADLVVGADGPASVVRTAGDFGARVSPSRTRYAWLRLGRALPGFVFAFLPGPGGLLRAAAYPYGADASTLIVEGLPELVEGLDADGLEALLPEALRGELSPPRWRAFPSIRTARRTADRTALVGDAAQTLYWSIGAGTPMALRQGWLLAEALREEPSLPRALARYDARTAPWVEATGDAAEADRLRLEALHELPLPEPRALASWFATRWD